MSNNTQVIIDGQLAVATAAQSGEIIASGGAKDLTCIVKDGNNKEQLALKVANLNGGGGGASLPDQTGNAGKFLTTDGSSPSWADVLPSFPAPSKTVTAQNYTSAYDLSGKIIDYLQFNDTPENTFKNTVGKTVAFDCNGVTVQMDYNYNTGANLYVTLLVGQDNYGSFYLCQNGVFEAQDINLFVNGTSFYWDATNKNFYADFTMSAASVTDMADIFNDNMLALGVVTEINPLPAASSYSGRLAYVYETGTYSDIKNLIYSDGTAWQFLPGTLLMIPEERMSAAVNQEIPSYCGINLTDGQLAIAGPNKAVPPASYFSIGQVHRVVYDSALYKWWQPLQFGQAAYQTSEYTLNKTSAYDPNNYDSFTQAWSMDFSNQMFLQEAGSILQTVVFYVSGIAYLSDLVFKTDANSIKVLFDNISQGALRVFYNGAEVSAADIAAGITLKANSIIAGRMYQGAYNCQIIELKDLPVSGGTALVALSGSTATLAANTDYTATIGGSAAFTLPTPSDTGISNTINILLNVTSASTIDWGVNANVAMTTFATGKYLIRLRYNNSSSHWIGEVLKGESVPGTTKAYFSFNDGYADGTGNITLTPVSGYTPVFSSEYTAFPGRKSLEVGNVNTKYFTPSGFNNIVFSGPFNIRFWVQQGSGNNSLTLLNYVDSNSQSHNLLEIFSTYFKFAAATDAQASSIQNVLYVQSQNFVLRNEMHYVEISRDSNNTVRLFIDGVVKATSAYSNDIYIPANKALFSPQMWYIQDFVFENQVGHTSAYDVPTTPYAVTDNSLSDYHDGKLAAEVNEKQADLTGIAGYDASKTQVLKNVQGVLTWVDEAV